MAREKKEEEKIVRSFFFLALHAGHTVGVHVCVCAGNSVYVKLACETSRRTAGSRRGREGRGECRGGVANRKFLGLL